MKIKRASLILASGVALYVAVAALSPGAHEGRPFLQKLFAPVPEALADLSGTRLKSKYTAGSDGSRLYEPDVLHDSTLNADCSFAIAADGKIRCLPTLAPTSVGGFVLYSDDKCTQRITFLNAAPAGCAPNPAKYVFSQDPAPYCAPDTQITTHIYTVGQLLGPNILAYSLSSGMCRASQSSSSGFVYYSLGDEVPASTFAEGTVGTDQ